MIKYNDIRLIAGLLFVFLLVNLSIELVPWNYVIVLGGGVGVVALYAKYDLGSSFNRKSRRDVKVEPYEAPQKINEKVARSQGYKKIDLEKTGSSSKTFHVDTQEVEIHGDERNLMFGVVGRAANPYQDNQIVAYIYDLHEDRIRKYSSHRYTGQSRIQPFEGKHSWLQAEGISRKTIEDTDDRSNPSVVVENNTAKKSEGE